MRSSISSSESAATRLPRLPWWTVLGSALTIAAACVIAMEAALRMRGFNPTIIDTPARWTQERARAARVGKQALILVGDSRVQTDLDLDVLHARSGLVPVELGLAGNSFVPVLDGLARDEHVTGTVFVGFSDAEVTRWNGYTAASLYEAAYERSPNAQPRNYHVVENALRDALHGKLASYADGASPLDSLLLRILGPAATPQYILTLPDRSFLVDYRGVDVAAMRYRHGIFEIEGMPPKSMPPGGLEVLSKRIETIDADLPQLYREQCARIETAVRAIESRGGRVIFAMLPTSGYVAEIDARRFPRERFWDVFCAATSAQCLRWDDVPDLRRFVPADDLHLDRRERAAFTAALWQALVSAAPRKREAPR
jgi:hypothetical protein